MTQTNFHWKREWITSRMLAAVGSITLEWSLIDHIIIEMIQRLWLYEHQDAEIIPRSFDKRVAELKRMASILYANEPDEFRTYAWFDQRLRTVNGKRDAISHCMPGRITRNGKTLEGLHVLFPSNPMPRYTSMTLDEIERLVVEMQDMYREAIEVNYAISQALTASSQNTVVWPPPYKLRPVAPGHRDPMLPKRLPPPTTFRA